MKQSYWSFKNDVQINHRALCYADGWDREIEFADEFDLRSYKTESKQKQSDKTEWNRKWKLL